MRQPGESGINERVAPNTEGMYAAAMGHRRQIIYPIQCAILWVFAAWAVSGCASDALSLDAPNIIDVTPQPSIVSIGESIRVDFYPQSDVADGAESGIRQLDTASIESLGILVDGWSFRSAFDFSISMSVSERAQTGIFQIEIPLTNEYERFVARFNLQVTR